MNISCASTTDYSVLPQSVSLVIPAHNEADNIEILMDLLAQTFQNLGFTLPVLLIDDGSTDGSSEILKQMKQKYNFLKVITHSCRRGVKEVWKTALADIKTDWILWGQADLETDPRTDIPLLLSACKPGVDAVAGWRQERKDGKLFASRIANWASCRVFGLKIHDMNWIKLVRRDLISVELLDWTTHRYLLAVLAGFGYNITEVPTPWHPRHSGKSKFGKGRLVSAFIDFFKLLSWWLFINFLKPIPHKNIKKLQYPA